MTRRKRRNPENRRKILGWIFCIAAILTGGFVGFKMASVPGLFDGGASDEQGERAGDGGIVLAASARPVEGTVANHIIPVSAPQNGAVAQGMIKVSFDGTSDPEMNWEFAPEQASMTVPLGENRLAFYAARNMSDKAVTGEAAYSVTPVEAGRYVNKLACFCFDAQRLAPGQYVNMPISFFVDPAIADDPALRDLSDIKLSFAFYAVKTATQAEDRSGENGG
jgi:cytochrome c oxidase assembly protein subunit 11